MKISQLPLLAAIPLAATLLLVPPQVHADTYTILNLGSANGFDIQGIDTSGQVVILDTFTLDYLTYANGVIVNTTSTLPNLPYDNGISCNVPPGFAASTPDEASCNNGRTGFNSIFNPNGDQSGVYTGPISSLTLVGSESAGLGVLNASGDFAWTEGVMEENFEAIDLTNPQRAGLSSNECYGLVTSASVSGPLTAS